MILSNIRSLPPISTPPLSTPSGKQIAGLGLLAPRDCLSLRRCSKISRNRSSSSPTHDHALSMFDELGFWVKSLRAIICGTESAVLRTSRMGCDHSPRPLAGVDSDFKLLFTNCQKPEAHSSYHHLRSFVDDACRGETSSKACKKLSVNQSIQPDTLLQVGQRSAISISTVLEPGQFSSREGILDIWATAETMPVAQDFFSDEIETIRRFDPASL
ncbi:MAG: hypothetical protein U0X92_10750 [Anaerolineales bacterium]